MKDSRRKFIKKGASLAALSSIPISKALPKMVAISSDINARLCLAYFRGLSEDYKVELAKQMGIKGVVAPSSTWVANMKGSDTWSLPVMKAVKAAYADAGLEWKVLEGTPGMDKTKLGLDGRDEEIDHFIQLIKNMPEVGLDVICYNWMPVFNWYRTNRKKESRGGALVTSFKYNDIQDEPFEEYQDFTPEDSWKNLEYFLKAVVPEAEKYGVKLALHPDDPPVPVLRGLPRIMISVDAFKKMVELVPSPNNGITFCQGTFATMGEDIPSAIEYFGSREKIHFVHFRDIKGTKWDFEEAFHDDGITDMHLAMQKYYEIGFNGPIRPDHVPTMARDSNEFPGYSPLGTLFAIGYIKGLMESIEKGT